MTDDQIIVLAELIDDLALELTNIEYIANGTDQN